MGKKEYCESELIALAGSLGHLYRLYACSTEAELREAIGDHEYDHLFQTGRHPSFHNVRTYCIQNMTKSVGQYKDAAVDAMPSGLMTEIGKMDKYKQLEDLEAGIRNMSKNLSFLPS